MNMEPVISQSSRSVGTTMFRFAALHSELSQEDAQAAAAAPIPRSDPIHKSSINQFQVAAKTPMELSDSDFDMEVELDEGQDPNALDEERYLSLLVNAQTIQRGLSGWKKHLHKTKRTKLHHGDLESQRQERIVTATAKVARLQDKLRILEDLASACKPSDAWEWIAPETNDIDSAPSEALSTLVRIGRVNAAISEATAASTSLADYRNANKNIRQTRLKHAKACLRAARKIDDTFAMDTQVRTNLCAAMTGLNRAMNAEAVRLSDQKQEHASHDSANKVGKKHLRSNGAQAGREASRLLRRSRRLIPSRMEAVMASIDSALETLKISDNEGCTAVGKMQIESKQ